MEKNELKFEAYAQIAILIVATISFSYLMQESYEINNNELNNLNSGGLSEPGFILTLLNFVNKIIWNEKTLVSAQGIDVAIKTCIENNQGEKCIEYPASQCDSNCKSSCIGQRANDI